MTQPIVNFMTDETIGPKTARNFRDSSVLPVIDHVIKIIENISLKAVK
jgi:hypothetical protein